MPITPDMITWENKSPSQTITLSTGFEWPAFVTVYAQNFDVLQKEVSTLTPSNQQLLKLAEKFPTPASFWAETDNPFTTEDTEE